MPSSTTPETLEFVVAVYNESLCVSQLVTRLRGVKNQFPELDVSFLLINDGSSDDTWQKLVALAEGARDLKLINLSRNFGNQLAVTAGIDHTEATYVAIIDGDLQDPPELIRPMYDLLQTGFDVVYGKRRKRAGESRFKKITAYLFYRLIQRLCSVPIPADTGDFRLMRRQVVVALRGLRERHRFIRGMVPWLGFRAAPYLYDRDLRYAGETKYPFKKMLYFALDAIFSFSKSPLRMATYLGLSITTLGFLGVFYMLYLRLFSDKVVPGLMVTLAAVVVIGGVQILMLGVVGEYLGRVFEEVKNRPLYIVSEKRNLN